MKKFNQVIKVEVSVDEIAKKLLDTFQGEYAHRELLAETIIGTALHNGTLGYVYNSLNGFSADIDFKVGQIVDCKETVWQYRVKPGTVDADTPEYDRRAYPIGESKIIDIDVYRDKKLKIEYQVMSGKGEWSTDTGWVNHTECDGLYTDDTCTVSLTANPAML